LEDIVIDKVFAGRYRITEKIGIGGMAEVYKAADETLGRTVAIKVMLPQYAADETFAIRFRQEAQAAANLQSPYIVNIYDWGYEEMSQTYYIVMEYVRGTDLKTAVTQRGAINPRKVAEIGSQVATALGVAHSYDIIHRDIKPQNIMVQPDGNSKVMDFGIARANSANLTQTGSVLGTAYYVSPEQAQGRELTSATDIYSLGVVLYEAVCGRVPFDGPDAVSIAVKQVNEMPVPPRAIDSSIDPDLEAIILKAMQKNPADRFHTAEEMRRALNEYLQGKPISGVDPDARTRVITRPAVVPAMAGTEVMPELATAPTYTQAGGGMDGREGSGKSKSKTPLIVALVAVLAVLLVGIGLYVAFCTGNEGDIEVPKVVGMTEQDARTVIEAANLVVGEVKMESSETVAAGLVISQNPAAQSMVFEGTRINLVVSSGSGNIEVPSLVGLTAAEAEQALAALKLVYREGATRADADIEAGRVSDQSPAPGSKVKEGSEVVVHLSTGPETAQIPNVIGMTRAAAEAAIINSGFKVAFTDDEYSSSFDAGYVVSQDSVGTGTKGATVTLTVSSGPAPVPIEQVSVPNIVGLDVNAASNALTAVGLSLANPEDGVNKVVAAQDPVASTVVDRGSKVTATFVDP